MPNRPAPTPTRSTRAQSGGAERQLTHFNDALLSEYQLPKLEEFSVESPDQARVSSFLLKPPGFRAGRRYPVLFLIHGGPQGAWGESWTYRWNAQVFAAAGFVVVMPNPRGSTGYGQKFIDEINEDWGGKPFDDIMAVADYVANQPCVDPEKMAAAGGSYGGYMVDWLLGHTQRFKALVSHAGVYDLRERVRHDRGAVVPALGVRRHAVGQPRGVLDNVSPSNYAKTSARPTLVIHGELDFRVPFGQGLQLFTALQLQKVPSKLLLFPDEGHWIAKPQNSVLWYKTFIDWVKEWVNKPEPQPAVQTAKP